MKKILYMTIGIVSVILGLIGVFVPGLPTTPFLLLSSWLFYKSSKSLHDRLHRSRLGKYIRHYEAREGVSWLSKLISIVCMWNMIRIFSNREFTCTDLIIGAGMYWNWKCVVYSAYSKEVKDELSKNILDSFLLFLDHYVYNFSGNNDHFADFFAFKPFCSFRGRFYCSFNFGIGGS